MPWDVFISYASEDRERFVAPLAEALRRRRVQVWLDQDVLQASDPLTNTLSEGMALSGSAVLCLSEAYLHKSWPIRELSQLISSHRGRIVPILLPGFTRQALVARSPNLADAVSIDAGTMTLDEVANRVESAVIGRIQQQEIDLLQAIQARHWIRHREPSLLSTLGERFHDPGQIHRMVKNARALAQKAQPEAQTLGTGEIAWGQPATAIWDDVLTESAKKSPVALGAALLVIRRELGPGLVELERWIEKVTKESAS